MKNKYIKHTLLIVCLFCISLLIGCQSEEKEAITVVPMEIEESRGYSFDFIGGKDVMPIGGFYGPYTTGYSKNGNRLPDYVSDEIFELISDAGINLVVASSENYSSRPERVLKALELGEKYGVGLFVSDNNILRAIVSEAYPEEEIVNALIKYYDYESFCGVHLIDEPTTPYYMGGDYTRYISTYGYLAQMLENSLGVTCYENLLPVTNTKSAQESYEKYVEEFCETFNPKFLTWDHYIFDKSRGENYQMYFWNMDVIRQYSEKYDIPFWAFIQAGSQWAEGGLVEFDSETPYYPNEAQFNWNVNTSLAFGAQGIQYFPLIQPYHFAYGESTEWDCERNGVIGAFGNKTQWYNFAKNINKHIAEIDEVLMNSVNKGIIVSGTDAINDTARTSYVIESGKFQELISVDGDALIGCFNYNGKTALYVVNYSMEYAQHIVLEFNQKHDINMIQNAEKSYIKAEKLTLDMAAGEGVLLVIE